MIDAAHLEPDEGKWILVLEDDFGTHSFEVDPELIETALQPWREHQIEGELVRREFEASGRIGWEDYKEAQARMDPEWDAELTRIAELTRMAADYFRKYAKESPL
jgi:hypothetical protein